MTFDHMGCVAQAKMISRRICKNIEVIRILKKVFHSDLLKLSLKKIHNIADFLPDTTVFYDYNNCVAR